MEEILSRQYLKIAKFLKENYFPKRWFYGPAYAMALWSQLEQYRDMVFLMHKYMFQHLVKNDQTHWEFINYGILRTLENMDIDIEYTEQFHDNKRVINWQLLKCLCQVLNNNTEGVDQIGILVNCNQNKEGLIYDFDNDSKSKSHQYHNFSTALLCELAEQGFFRFEKNLRKAVDYIISIQKDDGDINYEGRGKKQIKGYAVGIYALLFCSEYEAAERALNYLLKYERKNQPFPLVLSDNEPSWRKLNGIPDGWESYNNYFDYIPLVGYYLKRSYDVISHT